MTLYVDPTTFGRFPCRLYMGPFVRNHIHLYYVMEITATNGNANKNSIKIRHVPPPSFV